MAFQCIRGVVTSRGVLTAGDIVDGLPDHEIKVLLAQGKIVPRAEYSTEAVEPVIQHRDPVAVQKRGRKGR